MATQVIRVSHATLVDSIYFDDDEVAHLDKVSVQPSYPQLSQTGSLTVDYVGQEHYRFEIVFKIARRSTFTKLRTIANIQDVFQARPFLADEDATEYDVLWPDIKELRQQFIRGRMERGYELSVNWEEQITGTCP